MNYLKTVLQVARFEFWRYFKLKDILYTFIFFLVTGAIGFLGTKFLMSNKSDAVKITVVGDYDFELADSENFVFVDRGESTDSELRDAVANKEIDALLILSQSKQGELIVRKLPTWESGLVSYLTGKQLELDLKSSGLSEERFSYLTSEYSLDVVYHEDSDKKSTKFEIVATVALFAMMFIGIMVGMGTLFTGITGEKNSRITEQVISIISPQAWIDGKILGISLMVTTYIGGLILIGMMFLSLGGIFGLLAFLPTEIIRVSALLQYFILSLLAYMFWFVTFGAVAATINDPNTSSKGSLMGLPMAMFIFTAAAIDNPDTIAVKLLSYFPPTAPATFPVRVILSDLAWWEFPLTAILLIVSIIFIRRVAGKIFSIGIMMHGKEPSFAEIFKWLRVG